MFHACILSLAAGLALTGLSGAEPGPVDWERARQLMQREQSGQVLGPDERAIVEAARAERTRLQAEGRWPPRVRVPGPGPATEFRQGSSTGLVPLTDGGPDGGLYGQGRNEPDPAMRAVETRLLAAIVPRAADGAPRAVADGGRIGLMSVGMSNASQEWEHFAQSMRDQPTVAPGVVLVDGALGSHDAHLWGSGDDPDPWRHIDRQLAAAGLTDAQVQAVWLKHALRLPQDYGAHHVRAFAGELRIILAKLHMRFANLRIVHCSSRSFGGWDQRAPPASPEPFAYQSAYAIRDLILAQAAGEWSLNPDPALGPVRCPLLRWGPYLWADGIRARADGLAWPRDAFVADGIHPSPAGKAAVADMLRAYYLTDASTAWFRR